VAITREKVTMQIRLTALLAALTVLLGAAAARAQTTTPPSALTGGGAAAFVSSAEAQVARSTILTNRAGWIMENFITNDTEALAADAGQTATELATRLAMEAARFDAVPVDPEVRRKLDLLKRGLVVAAPKDPKGSEELARILASMDGDYGRGKFCPGKDQPCQTINDLEKIMGESRDPDELRRAWEGWHQVSRPYRDRYARFVELANQGARELGYADTGALWRSSYDMPEKDFAPEMERLWLQLKPLYDSLHTYVRGRLQDRYGAAATRPDGLIPAHLLGNMWSQSWDNIYPLLAPPGAGQSNELTTALLAKKLAARDIVKDAEGFFVSLGFDPLPDTFWKRSLFEKPRDREVVCHASAWDLDDQLDVRIKMCIKTNAEDFITAHHELGHDFYFLSYRGLSPLYRSGANDGFHEAIGDTIALSVTPEYLKRVGLIDTVPGSDGDIELLLRRALDKIAFIPFAYLVDQWRWRVFAGQVGPQDYDKLWWDLRATYQGIARPEPAQAGGFDAGAKYHVASNTPYARYFLADILQFQFHRSLCKAAGYTGPLHRCSIYGNKEAGARLRAMLALGESRPWQEALHSMTGEDRMDASAILDYFAPLKTWLDEQNAARARRTLTAKR
jgi:peptidyl-dipeptidase A